jgi:hypothetical protein
MTEVAAAELRTRLLDFWGKITRARGIVCQRSAGCASAFQPAEANRVLYLNGILTTAIDVLIKDLYDTLTSGNINVEYYAPCTFQKEASQDEFVREATVMMLLEAQRLERLVQPDTPSHLAALVERIVARTRAVDDGCFALIAAHEALAPVLSMS